MKMKKVISFILVLAMIFCSVPAVYVSADSGWTLAQMKASFPHGKYWNHVAKSGHGYKQNAGWVHYGANCGDILFSVTDHPCYSHNAVAPVGQYDCNTYYNKATQCAGFAQLMADLAYPGATYVTSWSQVTNKSTAISVVKPGDVIHYKGGGADATWGHWVFVTGVSGSTVTLGECNVGDKCNIYWGRTFNLNNANSLTLYQAPYQWNPGADEYSLDVNAKLDGTDKGVLDGIATVDVYINGNLVADDVSDYFAKHPKGTSFEIKDIKVTGCAVNTGVESMSGTLTANADCRFVFETKHTLDNGAVTTEPTCTEKGVFTVSCVNCDYKETSEVDAYGHDYEYVTVDPDCTENAKEIYTCTRCSDTYEVDLGENVKWSEWSTEKPEGDDIVIQEGVQYRYYDKETKLSAESELEGWTLVGSAWNEGEAKSVSYVNSWPAGFNKNNSLYAQYNNAAPVNSETDTTKIVVGNTSVQGYIYWHWCSSSYNGSQPINRYINDYYSAWDSETNRAYDVFHAFYSTEYKGITASAGAVDFWNAGACNQVYWWQPTLNVMKTEYTEYTLVNEFTRDTEWSEWTTEEVSASDTRVVETRTVYRYSSNDVFATGHSWDEGKKVADGSMVYICTVCGETSKVQGEPDTDVPDTDVPDTEIPDEKPLVVMKGDVNGDGKITASDARITLRIAAGLHTPDAEQKLAADVNGDGKITASDARKILRVAAGLDEFSKN